MIIKTNKEEPIVNVCERAQETSISVKASWHNMFEESFLCVE